MRRILGTAVFSGMLGVTLFGIFLTPVFFYVVDWMSGAPIWKWALFRRMQLLGNVGLHWVHELATLGPARRLATRAKARVESDKIVAGPPPPV